MLKDGAGPKSAGASKILNLFKLVKNRQALFHKDVTKVWHSITKYQGHVLDITLVLPCRIVHKFFIGCIWNLDECTRGNRLGIFRIGRAYLPCGLSFKIIVFRFVVYFF